MSDDYRNKLVRLVRIDETVIGDRDDDDNEKIKTYIGKTALATSIYTDGRPCHDEAYMIVFEDGYRADAVASELELA